MADNILGHVWPEWQIVKQIGKGSFGVVYEAVRTDHSIESSAAIKVISIPQNESEIDSLRSEGLSMDATKAYLQSVVNEFIDEIRLMESFKGIQNIVSVEDYKVVEKVGELGWNIYIRMELLTPFNSYIRDKPLTEKEVIRLGVDICTALELCARRNVIHRDIKPENIFINLFGDFKLGDFGIARKLENVTGGLSRKGTYNYMAPEVEQGDPYDATVDLYSLGLVLYRLMNKNRFPFLETEQHLLNPNERADAVRRRMNGERLPAPCDASYDMAQVILCACEPDPSRRFASATVMKNALMSVMNGAYSERQDMLDEALSARHTSLTEDLNETLPVCRAPQAQDSLQKTIRTFSSKQTQISQTHKSAQKIVGAFGGKKKSKAPAIISAVLVSLLLVGESIFVISRFLDHKNNDKNTKEDNPTVSSGLPDGENHVYSDFDEEQIALIIEDAEALAANEHYTDALAKIKAGLAVYSEAGALLTKEEELTQTIEANSTTHSYLYIVDNCSWSQAFENARATGGYLARIGTMEEYLRILSEIEDKGLTHIEFRIGARRAHDGEDYHWVDENNVMFGEKINSDDYWACSEWLSGEPSYQWKTNSEEYIEIYLDQKAEKWVWNDVADNVYRADGNNYGYIIEFDS